MNNKNKMVLIIFSTILLTIAFLIGGVYLYLSEQSENEQYYNDGYVNGLLYTSKSESGNIVFNNNGTLEEITIIDACNNLIKNANEGNINE